MRAREGDVYNDVIIFSLWRLHAWSSGVSCVHCLPRETGNTAISCPVFILRHTPFWSGYICVRFLTVNSHEAQIAIYQRLAGTGDFSLAEKENRCREYL
jgi:hypothetical protein